MSRAAPGPQDLASPARRRRNPWWIPPFLGRVPDVPDPLLRVLGLVSLALFFESYDHSMLTSALKHIAAGLDIDESDMGGQLGLIRLGALPAFLIVPFADRFGRRRLFLASVLGISLGTLLTAFVQSAEQFVAVQMVTRSFMITSVSCAIVIVTEEFPAEHRGWGIGMLGALSACGVGFGALLFALVDVLPGGWRALYVVGAAPLFMLPLFRRGVPETARFVRRREEAAAEAAVAGPERWLGPIVGLVRGHPARSLGVAGVGFLTAMAAVSVFQFTGWFVQEVHGWRPWQFSVMVIFGGGVGIIGNVIAGRLGDRFGRRRVGFTVMAVFPLWVAAFYQGPGWMVPLGWVLFVFCATAQQTITRAVSTELFPTAYRGTASGWLALMETLGAATGLGVLGLGTRARGDIADMTSLLAVGAVVAGLVLLLLPETGQRELEAISEEPGARQAAGQEAR